MDGLYDIMAEYNLSYKELTNLIYRLGRCIFLDTDSIIRQLDDIYDDKEFNRDFSIEKRQEIRELLHNVFNLTIHEARMHGDKNWTVKELDDTENSIIEYVLNKQPKTKD